MAHAVTTASVPLKDRNPFLHVGQVSGGTCDPDKLCYVGICAHLEAGQFTGNISPAQIPNLLQKDLLRYYGGCITIRFPVMMKVSEGLL